MSADKNAPSPDSSRIWLVSVRAHLVTTSGQEVDRAGVGQAPAHDEDHGDHGGRRVSEAGERVFGRHDPHDQARPSSSAQNATRS